MKKITERIQKVMDGNTAAAEACRQMNPDVFGFYPITPTSYIGEKFSKFVADGEVETEYVCAESEHAAMSICVGASAAGTRAITATASQGLILMSEVLFNASGMRLPIILINGNRALSAPLSIHGDHGDAMAVRDAGWIQIFAENAQEMYDFLVCAPSIAEHADVRTPIMVCMDCFQTTHTMMNCTLEPDTEIQDFVGEHLSLAPLLDVDNPVSHGNFDRPDFYMEHKRAQLEGMNNAAKIIPEVFGKFAEKFGRGGIEMLDQYQCEDAEKIFVVLGSTAGTVRKSVDILRAAGQKVGMIRPKVFRPFPLDELVSALSDKSEVLVLDRMFPAGAHWGALGSEVASTMRSNPDVKIKNVIYGLGQRETTDQDFADVMDRFAELPEVPYWINLRD